MRIDLLPERTIGVVIAGDYDDGDRLELVIVNIIDGKAIKIIEIIDQSPLDIVVSDLNTSLYSVVLRSPTDTFRGTDKYVTMNMVLDVQQ